MKALAAAVLPVLAIALTDISLQLDNAVAISSVASGLPPSQRGPVLAVGLLLAGACLLTFTLFCSFLVERITWLKPVASLVLVVIAGKLMLEYLHR